MTTTTFEMPGYRVVKTFGVVRDIIVRSRSIVGMQAVTEVLRYGTAVLVEPNPV